MILHGAFWILKPFSLYDRITRMKTIILSLAALLLFAPYAHAETAKASFGMGCFWCAEHDFQKVDGVKDVVSGYEGGAKETATYEQVSRGGTGHFEAVEVTYDPAKTSYEKLLQVFWDNVDPFDAEGQFCDKGSQYGAIIFVANETERKQAQASLDALQSRHKDQKVTVKILDSKPFYPAEAYHQDYADNNKMHYALYRSGCGRDDRLKELHKD